MAKGDDIIMGNYQLSMLNYQLSEIIKIILQS